MYDYLQPGATVKDKAGTKKIVTEIREGNVHWIYAGRSDRRRHVMAYDRFIDTHFIVAGVPPVEHSRAA